MNEGGDAYALAMEQLMSKYTKDAREKYMVRPALLFPKHSLVVLLSHIGFERICFKISVLFI